MPAAPRSCQTCGPRRRVLRRRREAGGRERLQDLSRGPPAPSRGLPVPHPTLTGASGNRSPPPPGLHTCSSSHSSSSFLRGRLACCPCPPPGPQAPRPPGQAASFLPPGRGCLGVDPGLAWLPSGRSRRGRGARESRWAHSLPPPPLPGPLGPREAQALRALGQEAGRWGSGRV